jgi:hypothetical protein
MIVLLTLTTAGSDTGPFDLYSDLDGFSTPFETGVDKATLEAGYSTTVPDGASIVRITSTGDCVNSVDITLRLADCNLEGYVQAITTTTTTTFSGFCYPYELQTVDTSETATWITCDGNPEEHELGINDTYIIPCAREGSVVFNGPTTQGEVVCNTPLTSILLANSNVSGNDACNNYATIPATWFISGSTEFSDATGIYEDEYGFQVAVSAIYSNGLIYRYWDGVAFDAPTACTI